MRFALDFFNHFMMGAILMKLVVSLRKTRFALDFFTHFSMGAILMKMAVFPR